VQQFFMYVRCVTVHQSRDFEATSAKNQLKFHPTELRYWAGVRVHSSLDKLPPTSWCDSYWIIQSPACNALGDVFVLC